MLNKVSGKSYRLIIILAFMALTWPDHFRIIQYLTLSDNTQWIYLLFPLTFLLFIALELYEFLLFRYNQRNKLYSLFIYMIRLAPLLISFFFFEKDKFFAWFWEKDRIRSDERSALLEELKEYAGKAAERLTKEGFAGKILMLTTFDDEEYIIRSLKAGALGYLLKDSPAEELVLAARQAKNGTYQLAPGVMNKLMSRINPKKEVDGESEKERKSLLSSLSAR